MKVIDNSTAKPVLKVGTPPREGVGEPGFPVRDDSEQISYKYFTYDPSIRVGTPPREYESGEGEPRYSGPPNYGIGEPGFPGRDESEQISYKDSIYNSDIGDIDNKSDIITSELPKIPPSEDYMGERGKLEFLWQELQTEEQLPSQADFL